MYYITDIELCEACMNMTYECARARAHVCVCVCVWYKHKY